MLSWFLFGIIIGLCIRCVCQPYKNTEEKYGLVHQIKKNPLNPFMHKDIQVDMRKTKEDAAGFAEVKLKFKITDKPEEVCRIEDQLIQNINPK